MEKFIKILVITLITLLLLTGCAGIRNPQEAFDYLIFEASSIIPEYSYDDYEPDDSLPKKYDLRDLGVVTPVKSQKPWNTCWGFAAIAAAETSILSGLDTTYEETKLDLSEKHLIWFAKSRVIEENDSQFGEGLYYDGSDSLDSGGFTYTATSIFSSGTGVISEDTVPYKGASEKLSEDEKSYSKDDDWSVDEQYRHVQEYKLTESSLLPCPVRRDEDGYYIGYSAYATDCIKKELLEGRAVSISYCSEMGNEPEGPRYLNTSNNKWAHYTYEDAPYDHAVAIVGYDDTISRYSFLNHTSDLGEPYYPEGDGAWIVKNSWGSEYGEFPNYEVWGIKDEDGKATGYFYLSYYDHSIYGPESFEFEPSTEEDEYIINQYDFLQSKTTKSVYSEHEVKTANVFYSSSDKFIKAISLETCNEKIDANIKIYKLNQSFRTPEDGELIFEDNYKFDYAGYHKIELNEDLPIEKGKLIGIVVTQKANIDGNTYYEVFVDTQLIKDDDGVERAKGRVNKDESFIYIDDNKGWYDWAAVINLFSKNPGLNEYAYDNFPIKVYSKLQ